MLKPGGVLAFTDILRRDAMSAEEMSRLQREMTFPTLETLDGYRDLLASHACVLQLRDDLSEEWSRILLARLAMYRSLKQETVQKFGAAHFSRWDDTYAFFVGLYGEGKLGGGRFVARKG